MLCKATMRRSTTLSIKLLSVDFWKISYLVWSLYDWCKHKIDCKLIGRKNATIRNSWQCTPVVLPHIEIPSLKMVWHGSSRCADHENTNFKTNVPAPSEILRCQVLAWLAWFWLFLAAQTIAESKNLTYFLATLILKIQYHTILNCTTSKGLAEFL